MKITRRQLRQIINEVALTDETRNTAAAALKAEVQKEGGAMGLDAAKKITEDAAGVEMTEEEFVAFAAQLNILKHRDGDVVDVTGLPERE